MSAHPALAIRPARTADLPAINEIYNYYVVHSTATYQTEPETADSRIEWYTRHGAAHPVTVAEWDGQVVGWGSLSPFRERTAYARTVENSLYLHHDYHRRGIGRALLADLIERAAEAGHHTIIAGIDAEQSPSVALHRAAGFTEVARLRQVGFKFDRWLDVIYMQRMVGNGK